MAYIGTWNTSIPNNVTDPVSAVATNLLQTRKDIIQTLTPNLNLSTGGVPSGTYAAMAALTGMVAGQFYFDTTYNVLNVYTGTKWYPINYNAYNGQSNAILTSTTELRFTVNGGSAFAYSGVTYLIVTCNLLTNPNQNTNINLQYYNVGDGQWYGNNGSGSPGLNDYLTYLTTGDYHPTQQFTLGYSGSIPPKTTYMYRLTITGSAATFTQHTNDHQLYYSYTGTGV